MFILDMATKAIVLIKIAEKFVKTCRWQNTSLSRFESASQSSIFLKNEKTVQNV
jgi:hypothetical protein